jgi:hypothetical protein
MIQGFSTGSLAKGDFKSALNFLAAYPTVTAIELSALRESELPLLIDAIPFLSLKRYKFISLHAPSKLINYKESEIIELLLPVTRLHIPIIVHPDIISNFKIWRQLGNFLCIENMDKRKAIGRTAKDLERIFKELPEARFCLDLAHAKQVDPSMIECVKMLRQFKDRLLQFHISDVTSDSKHTSINVEAILAFRKISSLIPENIPFIIESPVPEWYIGRELMYMSSIFHKSDTYPRQHLSFI